VHLQILYVRGNLHEQQSVVLVEMAAKVDEVVIPPMLLVETLVLVARVLQ
jgi:hypothetical protein